MHLTEQAKAGRPLPSKLPPELMPASVKSRTGSFSGPVMGFQPAHSQQPMHVQSMPGMSVEGTNVQVFNRFLLKYYGFRMDKCQMFTKRRQVAQPENLSPMHFLWALT